MKRITLNYLLSMLSLVTIIFFATCKGDDGATGPLGPQGDQGIQGPQGDQGVAGQDGQDGQDGKDGQDGQDGKDGNANVTIISFLETDITWTVGTFGGRPANVYSLDTSAVTQDIIDHGAVLGFVNRYSMWIPLPFDFTNDGATSSFYIKYGFSLNTISLFAYQTTGVWEPSSSLAYKFLLITDNTVTKSTDAHQDIISRLRQAGVDINNYSEVMDYFGL